MSNFIYDDTALPALKSNRTALPVGEDPNKWVMSADWNVVVQALLDVQGFGRGAKWFGYTSQSSDPAPAGVNDYLWIRTSDGALMHNGNPIAPTVSQAASAVCDFYTVGGDVGISHANGDAFVDDPQTYGFTNAAGILVMEITGNSPARCFVFLTDGTDGIVLGHGVFDITWRCAATMTLAGAANGATDYSIVVGATPGNSLTPGGDPGLQFVAGISRTGNTHWWAQVQANTPAVDTGIPVVADGMHKFRIVYDSTLSTPSAKFYIDDVLKATITANLPANLTVQRWTGITNSPANNHMKWIADYVSHTYTFATPR